MQKSELVQIVLLLVLFVLLSGNLFSVCIAHEVTAESSSRTLYERARTAYKQQKLALAEELLNASLARAPQPSANNADMLRSLSMLLLVLNRSNELDREEATFNELFSILDSFPASACDRETIKNLGDYCPMLQGPNGLARASRVVQFIQQSDPTELSGATMADKHLEDMREYKKRCMRQISSLWKHQAGDESIIILLDLRNDGSVSHIQIANRSKDARLNEAALALVKSIPYSPFPATVSVSEFGLTIHFSDFSKQSLRGQMR